MIIGKLVESGYAELRTGPFGTQLHASDYVDEGRPVLNVRNVGFGEVRSEQLDFVTEETAQRLAGHVLREGDIIFGRKGAVERHAYISERFVGAVQGSDCIRLRIDMGAPIRPLFASFALRTNQHQEWMKNFCAHGVTMASLNQEILKQVELPDLTLEEQDRAVSVLRVFEHLIENNQRRVELLEQMAESIYREWFVHFRYPGHESIALVDSPVGPIPNDWTVRQLSNLVTTQYGYTESACDQPVGPRFLRGKDINKKSFVDWSTVPFCLICDADRVKFQISKGDIFVIRMADPGKVGICERTVDAVFASYLVRLRPKDERLKRYFLFFTLRGEQYQNWVTGASSGSTRQSISAKSMTEPTIVLPTISVQQLFEEQVEPIRSHLNSLIEQVTALSAIRDLLLPKLVAGQIDVSALDLDALVGSVA